MKESKENIEQILISSLKKSYNVWQNLGKAGKETVQKNKFRETALRVDVEIEEEIINYFRTIDFSVQVHTEEHGVIDIGHPQYLAVIDGLDGTRVFKNNREHGRYGTMLGIFAGHNPNYEDYLAGGVMEQASNRLYSASRGQGAFLMKDGQRIKISTSNKTNFSPDAVKIYIDEFFEFNRITFSQKLEGFNLEPYNPDKLGASSRSYVDLAAGKAEFVLECTRKGNLEIAASYGLIKEAGGVMLDFDGQSLGLKKYLDWGQKEQLPVITAANKKLAEKIIQYLNKQARK